jgi:repressor LexA
VDYNLNVLRRKGFLRRHADVSRGIELVGRQQSAVREVETVAVPLVGTIAAGRPIDLPSSDSPPAADSDYIELPQSIITSSDKLYALKVSGQSMIDALIDDGDLVVMEQAITVENGGMAAIRLVQENETTLKRVYPEGPTVRLQPANSTMDPIRVPADNVEILGRVVAVWRDLN